MLNRHAVVLFLGFAAILSLQPRPGATYTLAGSALLIVLIGLLLDSGQPGARSMLGRGLQALGVAGILADAVSAAAWSPPAGLAELGIALAVLGVFAEMVLGYGSLRFGIAIQAAGDGLFVLAFGLAIARRTHAPSTGGWVFILMAGALSLFAALYNGQLQIRRLRNPRTGWRYSVMSVDAGGLRLRTPTGEVRIAWNHFRGVQRLDGRHLILIFPAPLPLELKETSLPFEELRRSPPDSGPPDDSVPEQYGLILHEQELGRSLPDAEVELRARAGAVRPD